MNTWRNHNGAWLISVAGPAEPGDTVAVTRRNGTAENKTLGAFVAYGRDGAKLYAPAAAAPAERLRYRLGSIDRLMALFDRAGARLKFPGIVLAVPDTQYVIRVKKAAPSGRYPDTLNVVDASMRNVWYGRIHRDGNFELAAITPIVIASRLQEFAADPATVATDHWRLTGRCCFCNLPLEHSSSTAVGYGPVCADHYGLPWGAEAVAA